MPPSVLATGKANKFGTTATGDAGLNPAVKNQKWAS